MVLFAAFDNLMSHADSFAVEIREDAVAIIFRLLKRVNLGYVEVNLRSHHRRRYAGFEVEA